MTKEAKALHEHAVEIDTKLAALYEEKAKVEFKRNASKLSLARYAGIKPEYVTKTRREVRETADELLALIAAKLEAFPAWEAKEARRAVEAWSAVTAEIAAIRAAMKPLEADFEEHGWSRFFLVRNHGGHIHASMSCSTCFPTTSFGWLPGLSGLTEKDAVEAHGPLLCSVCFPSAPVEWTLGAPKKDEDDKCPGSGTHDHDSSGLRYMSPRARCNHCGVMTSVTSTGKLRGHKAKVAA